MVLKHIIDKNKNIINKYNMKNESCNENCDVEFKCKFGNDFIFCNSCKFYKNI